MGEGELELGVGTGGRAVLRVAGAEVVLVPDHVPVLRASLDLVMRRAANAASQRDPRGTAPTIPPRAVHYSADGTTAGARGTCGGMGGHEPYAVTNDPAGVTCRHCIKRLATRAEGSSAE